MNNLLNIDHLRKVSVRPPQHFGLGFIKVKISENERVNFYSTKISKLSNSVENPHTHKYSFESHILKGTLYQNIFHMRDGDQYKVRELDCKPSYCTVIREFTANLRTMAAIKHTEGDWYRMYPDAIHSVCADFCITHFTIIENNINPTALAFGDNDPYESTLTENDCWDIISSMLV